MFGFVLQMYFLKPRLNLNVSEIYVRLKVSEIYTVYSYAMADTRL